MVEYIQLLPDLSRAVLLRVDSIPDRNRLIESLLHALKSPPLSAQHLAREQILLNAVTREEEIWPEFQDSRAGEIDKAVKKAALETYYAIAPRDKPPPPLDKDERDIKRCRARLCFLLRGDKTLRRDPNLIVIDTGEEAWAAILIQLYQYHFDKEKDTRANAGQIEQNQRHIDEDGDEGTMIQIPDRQPEPDDDVKSRKPAVVSSESVWVMVGARYTDLFYRLARKYAAAMGREDMDRQDDVQHFYLLMARKVKRNLHSYKGQAPLTLLEDNADATRPSDSDKAENASPEVAPAPQRPAMPRTWMYAILTWNQVFPLYLREIDPDRAERRLPEPLMKWLDEREHVNKSILSMLEEGRLIHEVVAIVKTDARYCAELADYLACYGANASEKWRQTQVKIFYGFINGTATCDIALSLNVTQERCEAILELLRTESPPVYDRILTIRRAASPHIPLDKDVDDGEDATAIQIPDQQPEPNDIVEGGELRAMIHDALEQAIPDLSPVQLRLLMLLYVIPHSVQDIVAASSLYGLPFEKADQVYQMKYQILDKLYDAIAPLLAAKYQESSVKLEPGPRRTLIEDVVKNYLDGPNVLDCHSASTWQIYKTGGLSETDRRRLVAHLKICQVCSLQVMIVNAETQAPRPSAQPGPVAPPQQPASDTGGAL